MEKLLETILPMIIIIVLGILFNKNIIGEDGNRVLNYFVYYLTFPVLIFFSLANTNFKVILNLPFILAFMAGIIVTFLTAFIIFRLLKQNLAEANMRATSAAFANTAYLGYPLVIELFGEPALVPATISLCLPVFIVLLSTVLNEIGTRHKGTVHIIESALLPVVMNPLFLAFVLGLSSAIFQIKIPNVLTTTGHMLGSATIPCALFVIGGSLIQKQTFSTNQNLIFITFLKLILQPLITGILLILLQVHPLWITVGILTSASPTALLLPVLGQRYNVYKQGSSAIVLITTVLYLLLIPVYLYILRALYPDLIFA